MALTATLDPNGLGVLLSADFASVIPAGTVNRILNPSNEAGLLFTAGASSTVTSSTTFAHSGTTSARLTRSSGSGSAVAVTPSGVNGFPVSPGVTYTGSVYSQGTTGRNFTVGIAWFDSAGASTGSTTTGAAVADHVSNFDARASVTATAPATAMYAQLIVTVASVASTSEFHYLDDVQLERGSTATAYCDGRQTGCVWSGTADASMSVRPPYNRVTVTRDGVKVRGLDSAIAPGGMARGFDGEAPRGVLVTYSATVTNGVATLTPQTTTITLPALSTGRAAIRSLRTPALSVELLITELPEWESTRDVAVLYPIGAEFPSTAEGTRHGDAGQLIVRTETLAELAALRALLRSDGPYFVQFPTSWGEDDMYVSVSTATRRRLVRFGGEPRRNIPLQVTVVDRPATAGSAVAVPGHTYADSTVNFPTYTSRTGTYGSR